MRGPKGKSRENKILRGTFRHNVSTANPPIVDLVEDVSPPSHLDGHALAVWKELAPLLQEAKVLTKTDLRTLEAYCMAYGWSRDAYEAIQKLGVVIEHPTRGTAANPANAILKQAMAEMRQHGCLLGLDPITRGKIDTPADTSSANPFTDL